ncbi:MAG: DUF1707 SHOCT-like domain-containing protein [Streptosporangiaceae bacterium]
MTEPPSERELRASDTEREQIVESLREANVEGRLTLEEFTQRVDEAYAARTRGELELLTRDLPTAKAAPARQPVSRPEPARRTSRWIVAVMGGTNRRGRWRPAEQLNVVAVMGGGTLDLRQAEITSPEITITGVFVMGGLEVVVPEGVEVETSGFAFMGGRDEKLADVPRRPGTPLIRVRCFALMGGLTVRSAPQSPGDDEGGINRGPDYWAMSPHERHAYRHAQRYERQRRRFESRW